VAGALEQVREWRAVNTLVGVVACQQRHLPVFVPDPPDDAGDFACPLWLLRQLVLACLQAAGRWRMLQETRDRQEIMERIAALDIGKAELTC
jgi:hypothetical protein